jgi:hypothetical protein
VTTQREKTDKEQVLDVKFQASEYACTFEDYVVGARSANPPVPWQKVLYTIYQVSGQWLTNQTIRNWLGPALPSTKHR